MTKTHLKPSESIIPISNQSNTPSDPDHGHDHQQDHDHDHPTTCDVNGIIAGLDYDSFVLLPGTRNPRPGMKFAEETEPPVQESIDPDYQLDYSASMFESPSMPSVYFFPSAPPYWGSTTPFLLASSRLDGKKSKKKNKNKKKRDKQRQQRLKRDHFLRASLSLEQLSPHSPHSPHSAHSPHSVHSVHSAHSAHSPLSAHSTHSTHSPHSAHSYSTHSTPHSSPKNLLSKTPEPTSAKQPTKKKRNKQRRRGSGRARRASAPQYLLHEGMDAMNLQFAGLNVRDGATESFKTGYSPLGSLYTGRHGPTFWSQMPLYGEAY
eukprot:TRINITY_DN1237_c0_g1_i15.p1 TRINITY_DN1237_c0_g1~~TRINITY_DN1237_c0_g1_i15.p1  ORF type:complete len:362 (-),score=34.33 TRINITY_DN1237_c0_g1_i15:225-1184(-)